MAPACGGGECEGGLLLQVQPARRQQSRLKSARHPGFKMRFKAFQHQIIQDNGPLASESIRAVRYRSCPVTGSS